MKKHADIVQTSAAEAAVLLEKWKENNIAGVINVAHNVSPRIKYDPWLPVLNHPHRDEIRPEPEWFKPVFAFYEWARKQGKVLVHCQAGANRSRGTFGVLLVTYHGMNARQALGITGMPGYGAWREAIEVMAKRKR